MISKMNIRKSKLMNKFLIIGMMLFVALLTEGCSRSEDIESNSDFLYQVATLQSLVKGNFYGYESIEDLLKNGDTGLGTFEGVNGEMIVLDGKCYQALADGTINEVDGKYFTPFASVKYLKEDYTKELNDIKNIDDLKEELNAIVNEEGKNSIYVGTIAGTFKNMLVRTVPAQEEPYMPLAEVLKKDQVEFNYDDIDGTLVFVYMPSYMGEVNTAGWHLHFIDKDCKVGGHVLDLSLASGKLVLDKAETFTMRIPNHKTFHDKALDDVAKEDIASFETGK